MSWTWMSKFCGFFFSSRTVVPSSQRRADAATSEELVASVDDDALTRRDTSLGRTELHDDDTVVPRVHHGTHVVSAGAHLDLRLERAAVRRLAGDPGHPVGLETASGKHLPGAHDHAVARSLDVHDVGP